jgi:predicted RNase H-like nuclease (RuvC/YqgF family)
MLHFMERLLDGKEARCAQGAKAKSQISDSKSQISDLKSQISNLRFRIAKLRSLAESCSRQIRGWADSLQNSEIRGQRHLTDDVRRQAAAKKRADAFRRQLDETLRAAQPQIFGQPTVES